jgi:UrcA family protein
MLNTLIALTLLASPAVLPDAQSSRTAQVRQSDLNLASAHGRRILDQRIASAVDKVCPVDKAGYVTKSTPGLRCRTETKARLASQRAQAVARADRPAQPTAGSR